MAIAMAFAVAVIAVVFPSLRVESQRAEVPKAAVKRADLPVADLLADSNLGETADPLREKRNRRFDSGFESGKVARFQFSENSPAEIYESPPSHPEIDPLPTYASDTVVTGTITNRRAFLSQDQSSIYSEFHFLIEDVLSGDFDSAMQKKPTLIVTRRGGRLRLPSGKILIRAGFIETMPLMDERYLLFLMFRPETSSYDLLTGYKLSGGLVMPLDGVNPSKSAQRIAEFARFDGMKEEEFLGLVRRTILENSKPRGIKDE